MLVLFLDHQWDWCSVKTLLKLFDATLLDSTECHLHYYDFRHSLNVIYILINFLNFFLDTQQNEFTINLGTFKIGYIMPKLLESYGILQEVGVGRKMSI